MAKSNLTGPGKTVEQPVQIIEAKPSIRIVSCDTLQDVACYQTALSAGCDICASTSATVRMGEVQKIKTNVRLLVENWKDMEGFVTYAQLHPRSSLRAKGISMLGTGVVDLDYTGEIILLVTNHCEINVRINTGDRVGQLIFCQALRPNGIPISEAIRVGGLGSTGS